MVLFGSVAKVTARLDSDIDIAVVVEPFGESRVREGGDILLASKDIGVVLTISTVGSFFRGVLKSVVPYLRCTTG